MNNDAVIEYHPRWQTSEKFIEFIKYLQQNDMMYDLDEKNINIPTHQFKYVRT